MNSERMLKNMTRTVYELDQGLDFLMKSDVFRPTPRDLTKHQRIDRLRNTVRLFEDQLNEYEKSIPK